MIRVVVDTIQCAREFLINGRLKADRVVSTLPLREAPRVFGLPEEAFKAAERLDCNSVVVVGVGLRREALRCHWVYVPDKRYPLRRYAWISNYGEDAPPGREVNLEGLKLEVVQGLAEVGELREGEVDVVAWDHGYGYPVYTLTHSSDVATVERCARWGGWQYWNTDRIFEEAQKLTL